MLIELKVKYRYSHTTPVKGVRHYLVKYECPTQTNKYCLSSPWDKDCIGHLYYVPVDKYEEQEHSDVPIRELGRREEQVPEEVGKILFDFKANWE